MTNLSQGLDGVNGHQVFSIALDETPVKSVKLPTVITTSTDGSGWTVTT